jgi:hypothetical protein
MLEENFTIHMIHEFYYLNCECKLYALGRIIIGLYNLKQMKRIFACVWTHQINLSRWLLYSYRLTNQLRSQALLWPFGGVVLSNTLPSINLNSMVWVRERTIPTERPQLVGDVGANFADRGCHVVTLTDPYCCILDFLDRSRYFFFPSSSSVVLTRLSGARSRPSTSQKMW